MNQGSKNKTKLKVVKLDDKRPLGDEGREDEVKTLTALEKHYRLLIKQGELYEPRF